MTAPIPPIALSIQQPWAWLIANGRKQIENRSWRTEFRGPIAIHAGKKPDRETLDTLRADIHPVLGMRMMPSWMDKDALSNLPQGGIIGVCEIYACTDESEDEWFVGPYGFLIRNAHPVDFIPCRGALGFFRWEKGAAQ
jgi:hypothetical protein